MAPFLANLLTLVPPAPPPGAGSNLVFFLYLGPQTVLPLASILAAAVGVLLLFGRRFSGLARSFFKAVRGRIKRVPAGEPESEDAPQETDQSAQT